MLKLEPIEMAYLKRCSEIETAREAFARRMRKLLSISVSKTILTSEDKSIYFPIESIGYIYFYSTPKKIEIGLESSQTKILQKARHIITKSKIKKYINNNNKFISVSCTEKNLLVAISVFIKTLKTL